MKSSDMALYEISENTPVIITTYKGSSFEATYRGFIPETERYEFGIRIAPGKETTVLFDKKTIKTYKLKTGKSAQAYME